MTDRSDLFFLSLKMFLTVIWVSMTALKFAILPIFQVAVIVTRVFNSNQMEEHVMVRQPFLSCLLIVFLFSDVSADYILLL